MRASRNVFLTAALAASIAGAGAARPMAQEAEKLVAAEKMAWVGAEMRFAGRTVQGAPYSAHAVTEFTQTLPDGNRIVRRSTALLYRDSEGRTRREPQSDGTRAYLHASPGAVTGGKLHVGPAPFGMTGVMRPEFVVITDPVAGVEHVLDAKNRSAQSRKVALPPEKSELLEKVRGKIEMAKRKEASDGNRTESLGRQVVDGIDAEGTRTVTTIAAGAIGNERPIEMVSERWFSPELQIVVRTRHSDPRSGETVYRLTNFSRAEPQRSLFEVPSDYTVRQSPAFKSRGPRP